MSDDNIIRPNFITMNPIDPDDVIAEAAGESFERVIVIGKLKNGKEYFAFSDPDAGTLIWDLERLKYAIMQKADEDDQ